MNDSMKVGFSQRIQLQWLEETAQLMLAGYTKPQIQEALDHLLRRQLSVDSSAPGGNRSKAVSILLNIWVSVPSHLKAFRDDGLEHLQRLPPTQHLPVHWSMMIAAYPFFGAVVESVGRLLKLQGTVSASQAQRRIREQFGQRETVERATRRILRCLIDWHVLLETEEKGTYAPAPTTSISDDQLIYWVIEGVMLSTSRDALSLSFAPQAPILFPFELSQPRFSSIESNNRLEILRQGLDQDLITFRGLRVSA